MLRPNVARGLITVVMLFVVLISTITVAAQPVPVRVVQRSDGALFVVQGTSAWPLVPDQISNDVFTNLVTVGDEVDGTLPGPLEFPPISGSVSLTSDGTLYYIQGTMGYPLVPDLIADSDLATLTLGSEIDGNVPRALLTNRHLRTSVWKVQPSWRTICTVSAVGRSRSEGATWAPTVPRSTARTMVYPARCWCVSV